MSYELAGIGIIRTIRSDPELAATPLILISAVLSDDEDRFLPADERSMVNRFLSKPISPDELLAEVAASPVHCAARRASPQAHDLAASISLPSERDELHRQGHL